MIGARRDPAHPGVVFVHGAGYLQNAHKILGELLPRIHVPQPARVARLRRARPGLPRERRLRPRLAHRDLPPHGRQGSRRRRRRREVSHAQGAGEPEAHRRVRRQLRRLHHADGDVHDARRVRRRRGAAAGDRLGALQPRLHVEHPQYPQKDMDAYRRARRSISRTAERRAADLPRHGRHQRALPGQRPARAAADRAAQGQLVGGAVPGREPRLRGRHELGGRIQTHPETVRGHLKPHDPRRAS